jgi:DNA polymerase-3 subunit epsilon
LYFFFDTQTTGIPWNYKTQASDLRNCLRLVQLAWVLAVEEANELANAEYIIKPVGFTIPQDAFTIHGITTEMAAPKRVGLKFILTTVTPSIKQAFVLISYNVQFDEKILDAGLPQQHI